MKENYSLLPPYPCERDVWDTMKSETRPIVVYGMGNGADKLLVRFEKYGIAVADFFASDGFVRGHSFHGKRVKSFAEIKAEYADFAIALSFASGREEVLALFSSLDASYTLYIPDMPVSGTQYFDRAFYNENYEKIKEAYLSLSDERSRAVFASVLHYKLSGRFAPLMAYTDTADAILSLLPADMRTMLDGGAYHGDTARQALSRFPALSRVIAVEPDKRIYKKLCRYAEEEARVVPVFGALYNREGEATFFGSSNRNSSLVGASFEHREDSVPLLTVDAICASERVDYIKYDVEGSEREALEGSLATVKRDTPALLVSLYHRSEDIFLLPLLLREQLPDGYRLVLRRLGVVPAWDLDLLALPPCDR
ncbi:MAG: FkbM family methyltransferase [Clostridia bacterium]|nr:FkbM family methyltransferase [Clostridia bacterium]